MSKFAIAYSPPTPPRDQNRYWQELEKRLGVTFDAVQVPADSYEEKLAALTAAGELPDLVWLAPPDNHLRVIQQGAYTDLTPYISGDALLAFPNLARFPKRLWQVSAFNGKHYGVPYPLMRASNTFYFRQDWAERTGTPHPQSADAFLAQMVAFTRSDPDGNGRPDTYGLTAIGPRSSMGFECLLEMFRGPNEWRLNADGTLTRDIETTEYMQALEFARNLFAAGVYHPDARTMGIGQAKNAVISGTVGAVRAGLGGLLGKNGARGKARKLNSTANLIGWVPFGYDGGKAHFFTDRGHYGYAAIPAHLGKDPSRVRELLRICDYFAAPFGSEERLFLDAGLEGVHHRRTSDGDIELIDQGAAEIGDIAWITQNMPVCYYDVPGDAGYMQQLQADLLAIGVDDPTWGLYAPTAATRSGELTQLLVDKRLAVITGQEPLGMWKSFVADYNRRGGGQIRLEYENALKASPRQ